MINKNQIILDDFMNNTLELSIIVPVYNVGNYLRRCVDSILSQDYETYEIILVNDGSTDSSGVICDELAEQHVHISVIHKPNGGLSSARNAGLKVAKGKYIWFIDSDDYISAGVLSFMMSQITRDDYDALFFSYIKSDGKTLIGKPVGRYYPGVYTGKQIYSRGIANVSVCSFVSLKSLWLDNGVFFRENICFEDFEIGPRILRFIEKAIFLKSKVIPYMYYARAGSIMNQPDPLKRMNQIKDFFRIEESWQEWFSLSSPDANSYDMLIIKRGMNMLHRNLLNFVRNSNFSISTKLKLYAEYRRKGVFSWYYNGYRRDPYVGPTYIRVFWNTIGRSCILFSLFSIGEEVWKKLRCGKI